jgi:peroxiredoxin
VSEPRPPKPASPPEGDSAPLVEAPGRKQRRWRRWLLEFGVALLVYAGVSNWQQSGLLDADTPAPEFELSALDGSRVASHDLLGKRVILHFWATWCGVCQREFGMLERLHQELPQDTVLLSVVADGDRRSVKQFIAERGIDYPVLRATEEVLREFQVTAFPTNYFIDRQGNIASRSVGMSTGWAMRARAGCSP